MRGLFGLRRRLSGGVITKGLDEFPQLLSFPVGSSLVIDFPETPMSYTQSVSQSVLGAYYPLTVRSAVRVQTESPILCIRV